MPGIVLKGGQAVIDELIGDALDGLATGAQPIGRRRHRPVPVRHNAVDALAAELAAHAKHEDRFIHPLLRQKAPSLAARLDAAHVTLDTRLDQLQQVAAAASVPAATAPAGPAADPNALYRSLAAFTAAYLEHLAVEEGEALPALWDGCTDEEVLGILASFRGSRSDAENLAPCATRPQRSQHVPRRTGGNSVMSRSATAICQSRQRRTGSSTAARRSPESTCEVTMVAIARWARRRSLRQLASRAVGETIWSRYRVCLTGPVRPRPAR
jgi:hypothetical protein